MVALRNLTIILILLKLQSLAKKETSFVYQGKRGFLIDAAIRVRYNNLDKPKFEEKKCSVS